MILRGHVWTFGDHVDTDVIIPARYLDTTDPYELAAHCMEGLDAEFVSKLKPGDMIVAGENFGCGSSREQAPVAIKHAGIACVIAKSFARIFFRNAINIGLPILVSSGAVEHAQPGDELEVDLSSGTIHNLSRKTTDQAEPFPDFLQEIISAGGLINYTARRITTG